MKIHFTHTLAIVFVEAKLDGDTLDGTWSGSDASGTLKATRQP